LGSFWGISEGEHGWPTADPGGNSRFRRRSSAAGSLPLLSDHVVPISLDAICLGTRPSQAAKSRPFENTSPARLPLPQRWR
jgi:hypothetical protein